MTEQVNTKVNDINVDEIYYKNYEFINKQFKPKNRAYGTKFEKEMVEIWLGDGELIMRGKGKKPNLNITTRWGFRCMDFEFIDGYLVSNFFIRNGCKNYKFKCNDY